MLFWQQQHNALYSTHTVWYKGRRARAQKADENEHNIHVEIESRPRLRARNLEIIAMARKIQTAFHF